VDGAASRGVSHGHGNAGVSSVPVAARLPSAAGFVWTVLRTDFKTRYQPTVGGFLWALAKPLAMFVVLMAVFSLVFASDPRYRVNLIIGLFVWEFFAEATKVGLVSLHTKGYLLARAKFPMWIPVVASIGNALLTLGVFVLVIVLFLTLEGRPPTAWALGLFVWYLADAALMVTGFSLAASVLFLRYRDLNQVWDVVIQAGFFVAPVVYPLGILPERVHAWLYLWPPTPIIQFSRAVLVDGVAPSVTGHALLTFGTAVVLGAGILVYRRLGPRAPEYV
jgi:ABC-type polysaccharide/polyol phosphate export permease